MFKYIELFGGVGGFRQALDPLGGRCVFTSEIDPFAKRAYRSLFPRYNLFGDITKVDVDNIPAHDLLVGGFPCQAFSIAGQQKGFEDTRGTLFFEIARIASAKRPRFMLLENVKNLLSHDNGKTFETMCIVLSDIGYGIDFTVLNSKFFGVPQNRERVFIVCSRDADYVDWDISGSGVVAKAKHRLSDLYVRSFSFPWPTNDKVTTRLRDILEANVDEKYYLSEEKTAALIAQLEDRQHTDGIKCIQQNQRRELSVKDEIGTLLITMTGNQAPKVLEPFLIDDQGRTQKQLKPLDICPTLRREMHGNEPRVVEPIMVGSLEHYGNDQMNRVYSVEGISPTITVVSGGGREQKIAEPIMVGRIEQGGHDQRKRVYDADGISPCLNGIGNGGGHEPKIVVESVCNTNPSGRGLNGNVYDSNGLSPTLTTNKGEGPKVVEYSREEGIGKELDVAFTLNSTDWRGLNRNQKQNAVLEKIGHLPSDKGQTGAVYDPHGLAPTQLNQHGNAVTKIAEEVRPVLTPDRPEKRQNGRRFKEDDEESFTLTGQDRHGIAIGQYPRYRIRRLTPLECWRLQGFLDEALNKVKAAGVSDSQLYKQAGNAVTVNVIEAIGIKLVPMVLNLDTHIYLER